MTYFAYHRSAAYVRFRLLTTCHGRNNGRNFVDENEKGTKIRQMLAVDFGRRNEFENVYEGKLRTAQDALLISVTVDLSAVLHSICQSIN